MNGLYDSDFVAWAETMAQCLSERRFSELDLENLVEEVQDLSKRERDRPLNAMRLITHHLLKWQFLPHQRKRSWQLTIERERTNIYLFLQDSPSLIEYLNDEWLDKAYRVARLDAAKETGLDFPVQCPYTVEQVQGFDYLPS